MGSPLDISGEYQQQFPHMVFFMVSIAGIKAENTDTMKSQLSLAWYRGV
jgi:hypothetical protein